jgi:hypothetical protein
MKLNKNLIINKSYLLGGKSAAIRYRYIDNSNYLPHNSADNTIQNNAAYTIEKRHGLKNA